MLASLFRREPTGIDFMDACIRNDLEAVKAYVLSFLRHRQMPEILNDTTLPYLPLNIALTKHNFPLITLLLDADADPLARLKNNNTPLNQALNCNFSLALLVLFYILKRQRNYLDIEVWGDPTSLDGDYRLIRLEEKLTRINCKPKGANYKTLFIERAEDFICALDHLAEAQTALAAGDKAAAAERYCLASDVLTRQMDFEIHRKPKNFRDPIKDPDPELLKFYMRERADCLYPAYSLYRSLDAALRTKVSLTPAEKVQHKQCLERLKVIAKSLNMSEETAKYEQRIATFDRLAAIFEVSPGTPDPANISTESDADESDSETNPLLRRTRQSGDAGCCGL